MYNIWSNLGHLEHARMNADSTNTKRLILMQKQPTQQQQVQQLLQNNNHHRIKAVDKIATCLPFGRSKHYYKQLLLEWSNNNVLKESGKVVLVVDHPSLRPILHMLSSKPQPIIPL
jgi:hypothetical protein